jgi:hypothetical protein
MIDQDRNRSDLLIPHLIRSKYELLCFIDAIVILIEGTSQLSIEKNLLLLKFFRCSLFETRTYVICITQLKMYNKNLNKRNSWTLESVYQIKVMRNHSLLHRCMIVRFHHRVFIKLKNAMMNNLCKTSLIYYLFGSSIIILNLEKFEYLFKLIRLQVIIESSQITMLSTLLKLIRHANYLFLYPWWDTNK